MSAIRKFFSAGKIILFLSILLILYCIACNIIQNIPNVPETIKKIFGLNDFANMATGALLGFGASLFLENLLINKNKVKAIENITLEMVNVCVLINGIFLTKSAHEKLLKLMKCFDDDKYNYNSYNKEHDKVGLEILEKKVVVRKFAVYLPIWDSIIQNGDLLKFKDKDYFEFLINIYTRLQKFKIVIDSFDEDKLTEEKKYNYFKNLYRDVVRLRKIMKCGEDAVKLLCANMSDDSVNEFFDDFDIK